MTDPQSQLAALLSQMQENEKDSCNDNEQHVMLLKEEADLSTQKILMQKHLDSKNLSEGHTADEQQKQWEEFVQAALSCPLLEQVEPQDLHEETLWEDLGIDTLGKYLVARAVSMEIKRGAGDQDVKETKTLGDLKALFYEVKDTLTGH